jgi:hypothetical protein
MTASGRRAVPLRRLPRRSISRLSVKASQGAVMSAPDSISLKPESLPLEGSRDTGDGILISIYPDVCLTPVGGVMVAIAHLGHVRFVSLTSISPILSQVFWPFIRLMAKELYLKGLLTSCRAVMAVILI